jgi:hypothetical protein
MNIEMDYRPTAILSHRDAGFKPRNSQAETVFWGFSQNDTSY